MKELGKTEPRIILATLAFAAAMYLVCLWRFYAIVGQGFVKLGRLPEHQHRQGLGPAVDPVLKLFCRHHDEQHNPQRDHGAGLLPVDFLLLFVVATVITRNLFAWSVDRILPDAVTSVDRRFHSPWVATLIVIVASEILLALYVFTTFFQQVSNCIVLYSIAFWVASFAAILLPHRRSAGRRDPMRCCSWSASTWRASSSAHPVSSRSPFSRRSTS